MARSVAQHDYWFITRELTFSAFKLRDQRTLLGFLWTLLQPLAMLAVLYWVFGTRLGADIEYYSLYVLIGIVLYTFFSSGTNKGLLSLVTRADLIDSVTFPRAIIPLSAVLTIVFSSILEFGVVLLFAIGSGAGISWMWLWLPIILLIETILIVGCSLVLAPLYVYARDLDNIWNIVLRIGFFATPIFYIAEQHLSATGLRIYMLNPVTQIMHHARDVLLRHQAPALSGLAETLAVSLLIFGAGLVVFRHFAPDLAERI